MEEQRLQELYEQCKKELNSIGITFDAIEYGKTDIKLSKRNNKRYGCCKQENPVLSTKHIERKGRYRVVQYDRFQTHHIEISPWVMKLDEEIIKNTILHEMIHCLPCCNNHGAEFKAYAKQINSKLGYDIARVGNKEKDYQKSNLEYHETEEYKYKITCQNCGQFFYRKRYRRNFVRKYRCAKCGGKFVVKEL